MSGFQADASFYLFVNQSIVGTRSLWLSGFDTSGVRFRQVYHGMLFSLLKITNTKIEIP